MARFAGLTAIEAHPIVRVVVPWHCSLLGPTNVALIVAVPVAVGVPNTRPVLVLKARPVGRFVADQTYVAPEPAPVAVGVAS